MRWFVLFCLVFSTQGHIFRSTPTYVDTYDMSDIVENRLNPYTRKDNFIYFKDVDNDPLTIYSMDLLPIGEISNIQVECYTPDVCENDLTNMERKLLTLYASMIQASNTVPIDKEYSIGVIRDKNEPYVNGRFTIFHDNSISFWIRLMHGDYRNKDYVYDGLESLPLTISIVELALHERAHYDVALHDMNETHCNFYQSVYNYHIQNAARRIEQYHKMTRYIMGRNSYTNMYLVSLTAVVFFLVVAFTLPTRTSNKRLVRAERYNVLP